MPVHILATRLDVIVYMLEPGYESPGCTQSCISQSPGTLVAELSVQTMKIVPYSAVSKTLLCGAQMSIRNLPSRVFPEKVMLRSLSYFLVFAF